MVHKSRHTVAPVRERGLKFDGQQPQFLQLAVAPVRERGLKSLVALKFSILFGRSREGAWIEIDASINMPAGYLSLP